MFSFLENIVTSNLVLLFIYSKNYLMCFFFLLVVSFAKCTHGKNSREQLPAPCQHDFAENDKNLK